MLDTIFARRVTPLTPSQYGYMRVFLITSQQVPAPPYVGTLRPSTYQALLLLSLSCHAGVKPAQLARMRVDALIGADGEPRDHVHIRAETTKHRLAEKVKMHPDVRRDVLEFCKHHPDKEWVAFVNERGAVASNRQMSGHGLWKWFQSVFHIAEVSGAESRGGARVFGNALRFG